MKPRRWFITPELTQWRYMCECGDYYEPFFHWPNYNLQAKPNAVSIALRNELRKNFISNMDWEARG